MGRPPEKKKQIESAAIKLFANQGFASTSIKDIAIEAGVTDGALYRHYKSKNEMGWVLFSQEVEKFSTGLQEIFKEVDPGNSLQALKTGIKYTYEYYDKYPIEFRFILVNQHTFPQGKLLDKQSNPMDLVIQAVAHGTGHLENFDYISSMIWGALVNPLVMHQYGRLEKKPIECVDLVVEKCSAILAS